MNPEFWKGRRVFITGHTGFRGSWLSLALQKAGAKVFGFSLSPATNPNLFEVANVGQNMTSTFGDVCDSALLKSALEFSEAEVVFHLAGGGGLKDSWDRVQDVFQSQVMGTIHVLEALRETATVRSVVILSSDKIYRPQDVPAVEDSPLRGSAPAATAKACVELIVESYLSGVFSPEKFNKHKLALATARGPIVMGGGDFSPDSLLWQLAQACQNGLDLPLRNPQSLRTWMHVDDFTNGMMTLAEALLEKGPKASGAWNLGVGVDHQATVGKAAELFVQNYGGASKVPASASASLSVHNFLDSSKAEKELSWKAQVSLEESFLKTAHWYKNYFQGGS